MILVVAGTSDARELALQIKGAGYHLLTSVVTENAAKGMEEAGLPVRYGRLNEDELVQLIVSGGFKVVIDASHPFAEEASKNTIAAAFRANVPYIRYERERLSYHDHPQLFYVDTYEQAAEMAFIKQGVIMLTTGSKTLKVFTNKLLGLPNTTLIARMLPRKDNMEKCEELGLEQKNIVAMQGPFIEELNTALYKQYKVTLMITKESGKAGAVDEKVEAALKLGIETIIIGRPAVDYGNQHSDFSAVLTHITQLLEEA
ncbi:precorrin-6A reductase [Cohnella sp.]|uniref:precorrin-6A reductase n=1 Tax=Cohnella sp. TaxID=1883426 RepID=UPI003564B78F